MAEKKMQGAIEEIFLMTIHFMASNKSYTH